MKQFISFSGGVESSTMCVLFGNKADAIFADTGEEHQEIYDRIELVENWCKKFHRKDFKIHIVKNEKYKSLGDYIVIRKYLPNITARYCTRMFKIEPIDKFLKQFKNEGVEIMIGLNYEEAELRKGNHGLLPFVTYSYPLIENLISRSGCYKILDYANLRPNFPPYMKRGGCKDCYFKSENEYKAMALLSPSDFEYVENLENRIQDRRKTFFTILPNKKSMSIIRMEAKSSLFKPKEMYPTINNMTKCGVFCNR